jgi:hypothetical protein
MGAQLLEFSLPPGLLQRGFWLYVWKIRGPNDEALCYVGMTGDVTGVAQSPFVRAHTHLDDNKNSNALRSRLREHDIDPRHCRELVFSAYGPIYDHEDSKNFDVNRKKVGALERALWDALQREGFKPVNRRPVFGDDYDLALFKEVRSAFARLFPIPTPSP